MGIGFKAIGGIRKKGADLSKLSQIIVPLAFKDRNRPQSRRGSGKFVRSNQSTGKLIDSYDLKTISKEMTDLRKFFDQVKTKSQDPVLMKSEEMDMVRLVLSELEERLDELEEEITNTRDTEMSKRDIWRAGVDIQAIEEKIEVIIYSAPKGKRHSNFW